MGLGVCVDGGDVVVMEEEDEAYNGGEDMATDDVYSSERARTRVLARKGAVTSGVLLVLDLERVGANDEVVHNRQ